MSVFWVIIGSLVRAQAAEGNKVLVPCVFQLTKCEQHQRFQDYKERDERKDALLKEHGWEVLRLVWKEVYNDPKEAIRCAKTFIEI